MERQQIKLSNRELDQPLALITDHGRVKTKTLQCFINDVHTLADILLPARNAVNFCGDRYRFLVTFFALCLNGQTNYLPPNRSIEAQRQMIEEDDQLYIIHDMDCLESPLETFQVPIDLDPRAIQCKVPSLAAEHLCAISFTSGSTGKPKAIDKYWGTLYAGAKINAKHMLGDISQTHHALATVPAQHLWGLETSVLLPLLAPVCISSKTPFYPADLVAALAETPSPRLLISTPTHIRALIGSELPIPRCEQILCATSPLDTALAKKLESEFSGKLTEVYGCTEMGSMAYRHTAREANWRAFDGFKFEQIDEQTIVHAKHVTGSTQLQDRLVFSDDEGFQIAGRTGDMINVGGKRGSLAQINQSILQIEGVLDSAVFLPEDDTMQTQRPAAIVVSCNKSLSKRQIQTTIRKTMDAVFVPRPILFADALPRSPNGKLPKLPLNQLYKSLKGSHG